MSARLVLASRSPRRRALLAQVGITFEVAAADVDENVREGEGPDALVRRLAIAKARAVAALSPPPVRGVLGADTVVACDGLLLNKPMSTKDAAAMIHRLSGRAHDVWTGLALAAPGGTLLDATAIRTRVVFRRLSADEVRGYAATGEGLDKAGAYAIQGVGAGLVTAIEGSYSNVVGLPLAETIAMLRAHGVLEAWP